MSARATLPDLARARVLVVGDVMLDRYWFGDVSRISPEAPVPIVKVTSTEERPGGAANVARNAAALGARVALLSVVGRDEAGDALARLIATEGIEAILHRDQTVATTVKLRVIARRQHALRVDFDIAPSHEVLAGKLADFNRMLGECDVVVLSDYGKGGLAHIAEMIGRARSRGKPVLVDPKGGDFSKYAGATVVTPNQAELREVVGHWRSEEDLATRAERLRSELALEALLLTRSEQGMTLYEAGGVTNERARAREVSDVTGAGDTVIGTLAVMLAGGASLAEAMRVANHAAGIVVGKLGTAVVRPEELHADLATPESAPRT
ncbi:MAG: D-glycero-beta-D-manno-heptose-7-phosphate kinase [Burkholderiales bacterium]|nr:D-glycero-beta-D-manno-heptose-7-phosphate kinase [Burkholderiales bacterium]